jgi:hypothetical protein
MLPSVGRGPSSLTPEEFALRRIIGFAAAGLCLTLVAPGCAGRFKRQEREIREQPINCATAQGDLRILQQEKAHVADRIAMGVTAIYPGGAVVGLVTGTEGTELQVAAGEYNHTIDQKIAAIRSECGL